MFLGSTNLNVTSSLPLHREDHRCHVHQIQRRMPRRRPRSRDLALALQCSQKRQQPSTTIRISLLVLLRLLPLCLGRTTERLGPVFSLLACKAPSAFFSQEIFDRRESQWQGNQCKRTLLPARLLNLRRLPDAHEAVVRLELLQRLDRVVEQAEAGTLAAAVCGTETEDRDLVLAGLVHLG